MSSKTYLKESVKNISILFVEEFHGVHDVLFWPDFEPIYYAKIVTGYLSDKILEFILKGKNPPSLPQVRGVERIWTNYKTIYSLRK